MKFSRSLIAKAGVAAVVLAAAGTASVAQARDHVYFSIGANVAPGVAIGASNAPYYYGPRYVAPAPVYVQPAPVYYEPAPVYYDAAPVYYGPPAVGIRYIWSPVHHRYYYMHHGRRYWR
jgi:hypothetical protein